MYYTERNKLSVIDFGKEEKRISFERLKKQILACPSRIIYFECNRKLYGMISVGDIERANDNGMNEVEINYFFRYIRYNEYMKARNIFGEKKNIYEIPVINSNNELLGSYSSGNDLLFSNLCMNKWNSLKGIIRLACKYRDIALVRPSGGFKIKDKNFNTMYEILSSVDIRAKIIYCHEIMNYIDCVEWILFADKDELLSSSVFYTCIMHKDFSKSKLKTYIDFFEEMKLEYKWKYLSDIKTKDVHVLNLVLPENVAYRKLMRKIYNRFTALHETIDYKIKPAMYPDFFDDIYTEEYAECIAHLQYAVENESRCGKLEDCKGRYYNVTNGKRHTVGQPTEYRKTIYFIGPCFIYGHYVEDKNTIESLLQKIINDKGYNVKVENCGSAYSENIMEIMLARIKEIPLKRGDVVVIYSYNRYLPEVSELNLMDVIERSDIKIEWMVDHPFHCNHKLNKVYAEAIFHELQPALTEKSEGAGLVKCEEDFVKTQYIDLYFSKYDLSVFKNIGSIVMNCNPFTFGHRYLIEKALEYVDFLIIFVVEEDRSLFSFIERFTMISEGVKDLDHVMVVPSGPFILSQTTFPEYFIKMLDENIGKNIKNDVSFFGERIAPLLNIKYRFVGEEPEDPVTNEYNKVMERLLPEKGVKYIEIPRKMAGRGYISASKVRKILELNDKKMIKELVPQSTMQLLFLKNM